MDLRRQVRNVQLENNDAIVSRLAEHDKVPWYRKPNLRLLYLLMVPTCLGVEVASGFDASMLSGLQAVSSWLEYFHHPSSALLGFMVAAYSLGFAAAAPFVPFVVDKMGRRYAILIGGVISIFAGFMQGSALNATMFIIARFVLGTASVFGIVAASSLIGEISHPNERAIMSGLFNTTYHLGSVAAAVIVLTTFAMPNNWGWRIPSLLQAAPSLVQVAFIWFLPESPRWLVSRGKGDEARAILVRFHAEGDEDSEFVKAEYSQIKQTLEAEQRISKTNWKEVFSTPGMRKRVTIAVFLALSVNWSGAGLISYFLPRILDSIGVHDNRTKNMINLAKISWGLVNATACAFIAPRYPRRKIFLISSISLLVVVTAWTIASAEYSFSHNKIFAQQVLILIFLYSPAYNLAFTALIYPFLVELFPFHVRAKGISIYQWWFRIAGFATDIMNPIGIDAVGWRWYIVYCFWLVFQIIFIYVMLPETSGRTLEELTFLYESKASTLREHQEIETNYGTMRDTSSTAS